MGRFPPLIPVLLLGSIPASAQAPDAERATVLAPIHGLFEAMRKGDSAGVRAVFHPQALLATAVTRDAGSGVRVDTLEAFVRAVGAPHELWDERIHSEKVEIDGPLAAVWTEYSFHAGKEFSHCGVNAFQLARSGSGWLIIAMTDTRRRQNCPGGAGR